MVNPVIAAVALGIATNTPWVAPVRAYLEQLYGTGPAVSSARRDQVALAAAAVAR